MRWQGQSLRGEDQAVLLPMKGLVRSVRTPEFDGVTFHEVAAKSALNKVPAQSNMPFKWTVNPTRGCLHQCRYCLSPNTWILMADGRQKLLRDVQVGDKVVGTRLRGSYRYFVESEVKAFWNTRKPAYRVTLNDGTEIESSGDHRFLTESGWKYVAPLPRTEGQRPALTTNNSLQGFGLGGLGAAYSKPLKNTYYRQGYLTGMIRGDAMMADRTYIRRNDGGSNRVTIFRLASVDSDALQRSKDFLAAEGIEATTKPYTQATDTRRALSVIITSKRQHYSAVAELIAWPEDPSREWEKGFLAGIYDAEGSFSASAVRISNSDEEMLLRTEQALDVLEIPHTRDVENDNGVTSIRIIGGRSLQHRFFQLVEPAITRKLHVLGKAVKTHSDLQVSYVEKLGSDRNLIDISTETEDFIANGVISHNCFARKTHEYLDFDSGRDFDSQIVVKTNVAEVLRAELAKPSWKREHVALGTNTDPYQRSEGRYALMPGIIRALADSGTPFSILTKGPLLKRDLPLLIEASKQVPVSVAVSLAIMDTELQQKVEPGTPDSRARLNLVRSITEAGLECNVMAMPILPWLTDSEDHLDRLHAELSAAGASWVTTGALHLRPGAREWYMQWLQAEYPKLVPKYRRLYRNARGDFGSYADKGYKQWLGQRSAAARGRHGFVDHPDGPWRGRDSPEESSPTTPSDQTDALPGLELSGQGGQPALF